MIIHEGNGDNPNILLYNMVTMIEKLDFSNFFF